ncbi:MAG: substrate-binding domain-containing protein [Rhodospirillaceae bacterium]|nr:substrate-binding domain-containing protein [Rhodospirillaceae bacterium]
MPIHSRSSLFCVLTFALGPITPAVAAERETIRIVGSSTMYPFLAEVAEDFGRDTPFRAPVIEATGTVGGFKIFCSDIGLNSPDIIAASRRITPIEEEDCLSHSIAEIAEFKVGYDGIVLAGSHNTPDFAASRATLWRALAQSVRTKDILIPNPYRTWSDIAPNFPKVPIRIYGPPLTSGTRDVFVHLVMNPGCAELPSTASDSMVRKTCGHIREDGAYINAGEDDEMVVKRLLDDPKALGIMGYGALKRHMHQIKGLPIEGVRPTDEALEDGRYPLSRPLYLYVKIAHIGRVPGLMDYVQRFLSERMIGTEGRLFQSGLIPMRDNERSFVWSTFMALKARTAH